MATTLKVVNGDIIVSSATGRPITVSGTDKLSQDISEFFRVNVLPNGFGAGLERLVGILSFNGDNVLIGLVDKYIRDGIADFRALQRSTNKIDRTADERVLGVRNVQVWQDTSDATKYYFKVDVLTESGKSVVVPATITARS